MTAHTYRSSKPDRWVIPRQSADISTRGPILPMDRPATAFENALIVLRIGLLPAVGLAALFAVATIAFVALTGGI